MSQRRSEKNVRPVLNRVAKSSISVLNGARVWVPGLHLPTETPAQYLPPGFDLGMLEKTLLRELCHVKRVLQF